MKPEQLRELVQLCAEETARTGSLRAGLVKPLLVQLEQHAQALALLAEIRFDIQTGALMGRAGVADYAKIAALLEAK